MADFWLSTIIVVIVAAILLLAYIFLPSYLSKPHPGTSGLENECIAASPYLCNYVTLSTSGQINFTVGQESGVAYYNVELACISTSNSLSASPSSEGIAYLPLPDISLPSTVYNLTTSQQVAVSLPCYVASGAFGSEPINTPFIGYIFLNYTNNPGNPNSSSNQWTSVQLATVSARVS